MADGVSCPRGNIYSISYIRLAAPVNMRYTLIFLLLCCYHGQAEIRLPRLISDHMVLQRGTRVPIWGWAAPGEMVTVSFKGEQHTSATGPDGRWALQLPAMEAGGPYNMAVSGSNTITVSDILVGDVWLCSGQSNMQLTMERVADRYAGIFAGCTNDNIRVLTVAAVNTYGPPQDDMTTTGWGPTDPGTILQYTAVGYFTARALYDKYKVPIGLINSSCGGSAAEAWISEDGLKKFPEYQKDLGLVKDKDTAQTDSIIRKNMADTRDWYARSQEEDKGLGTGASAWSAEGYDASAWPVIKLPASWADVDMEGNSGVVWFRKDVDVPAEMAGTPATLYLGSIKDQDVVWLNGQIVGTGADEHQQRAYLVRGDLLKPGRNVIVIRVLATGRQGGFTKTHTYRLQSTTRAIDITDGWRYRTGLIATAAAATAFFAHGSCHHFVQQYDSPSGTLCAQRCALVPGRDQCILSCRVRHTVRCVDNRLAQQVAAGRPSIHLCPDSQLSGAARGTRRKRNGGYQVCTVKGIGATQYRYGSDT